MARITGVLLAAMFVTFVVGEGGLPNLMGEPLPAMVEFFAMGIMLIGFGIGWRWQALGGIVALTGFMLFTGVEIATNGQLPRGAIPLFAIPGVLLLVSYVFSIVLRRKVTER